MAWVSPLGLEHGLIHSGYDLWSEFKAESCNELFQIKISPILVGMSTIMLLHVLSTEVNLNLSTVITNSSAPGELESFS